MPTNFPTGLLSRGVPLLGYGIPATKGDVYHVDSGHTNADDDNAGANPNQPLATLDAAVGKCTANNGDIILVSEGHAENITAATGINCDVAGITIIGLGRGNDLPTISFTAAAGSITVGAASVAIHNIKLVANFAGGVTAGITVAAAGDYCTLDGIVFRDTSATKEFLLHVSVATTVTDLVIRNCSGVTLAGSMTNSILFAGTSTDCVIEDNYLFVDSSDDVIDHLAGASVNLVVRRNVIVNADTGAAGYCVRYKSDGTGVCYRNLFGYDKVDAEIGIGAAAWWFENYGSNTIAESGLLDPATSHAIP